MKRITIFIAIAFILAGCSTNNIQKQSDKNATSSILTNIPQDQSTKTQAPVEDQASAAPESTQLQITTAEEPHRQQTASEKVLKIVFNYKK